MYSLGLQREFVSRHFLIGGDWGAENELHSHDYRMEVRLEADGLDTHGFIVDIVDLESSLDRVLERYREQTLNDLQEFESLNPSLEHFSRILCQKLRSEMSSTGLTSLEVRLWEDATAWAAYRQEA